MITGFPEKRIMRINNKLLKAGIGYTVGNILVKGAVFFTLPIFTRLMSPENFGLYSIYLTYSYIIYIFMGMVLHNTIKNARYDFPFKIENYVSSIFTFNVFTLSLGLMVVYLLPDSFIRIINFKKSIMYLLVFQSFSVSIFTIYNVYLSLSYAYKNYIKVTFLNTFFSIILSIFFICNFFQNESYIGRILGTTLPYVFLSLVIVWIIYRKADNIFNFQYIKYGLSFSLPLIIHGLSQVILGQIDRIIIQNYCGSYFTGLFSFAIIFNTVYSVFISSFDNVWGPWLYEKLNNANYSEIRTKTKKHMVIMTTIYTYILFFVPELTRILAGKEYFISVYSAVPLLLSGYFMYLYTIVVNVEYFFKKTSYIAMGTLLGGSVNVILAIMLVPVYGYKIAAYVHLLSYVVYFLFHYYSAYNLLKKDIFDLKILGYNILFVAVISLFVLYTIDHIYIRIAALTIITGFILMRAKSLVKS